MTDASESDGPRRATWDLVLAIALLGVLLVVAAAAVVAGSVTFLATGYCGEGCSEAVVWVAIVVAMGGPLLLLAVGIVMTVRRLRRGDRAWWMPLPWMLAAPIPVLLGIVIAQEAVRP